MSSPAYQRDTFTFTQGCGTFTFTHKGRTADIEAKAWASSHIQAEKTSMVDRLSSIFTAATSVGMKGILGGTLVHVARLTLNMRSLQYNENEVMLMTRAFFTSGTSQAAREAWDVLDRRRIGTIPGSDLLANLIDMLGPMAAIGLKTMISRLPSAHILRLQSGEQMVTQAEFPTLCASIKASANELVPSQLGGFLAEEVTELATGAVRGVGHVGRALQELELPVLAKVPPPLLPRAGAVIERMLAAEYTAHQASTAVAALYGPRDARSLARLWGLFDLRRTGVLPVAEFERAMLLLTNVVSAADLPAVRTRLGFLDPSKVTLHEFEAAITLLIPADGSEPKLVENRVDERPVNALLGGAANAQRLKPYERQRVVRLAARMTNFGYSHEAVLLVVRVLFLTKMHDKDLWDVWRLLHRGGVPAEAPLDVVQVRHLLGLLSEGNQVEDVNNLIAKVDENHNGELEFEELATLLRAIDPKLARNKLVEDIDIQPHPLLEQVRMAVDCLEDGRWLP